MFETIGERLFLALWDIMRILGYLCTVLANSHEGATSTNFDSRMSYQKRIIDNKHVKKTFIIINFLLTREGCQWCSVQAIKCKIPTGYRRCPLPDLNKWHWTEPRLLHITICRWHTSVEREVKDVAVSAKQTWWSTEDGKSTEDRHQ